MSISTAGLKKRVLNAPELSNYTHQAVENYEKFFLYKPNILSRNNISL